MKVVTHVCDWIGCEEEAYQYPFSMDAAVSKDLIQSRLPDFPRAVIRVGVLPYYALEKFQFEDLDDKFFCPPTQRRFESLEFCREHWKVFVYELGNELDNNLGFLEKK